MKQRNQNGEGAKPIPGATNQPKQMGPGKISNGVAMDPKSQPVVKIQGAISGPK